jgi:hypothetical protein
MRLPAEKIKEAILNPRPGASGCGHLFFIDLQMDWRMSVKGTIKVWFAQLTHEDQAVRRKAKQAVMNLEPGDKYAVPHLIEFLSSKNAVLGMWAARGLSCIGNSGYGCCSVPHRRFAK